MALQKIVNWCVTPLYYKVHNVPLFRDKAQIEVVYWHSKADHDAGMPFVGAEQYTVVDVAEQLDTDNNIIAPAKPAFTDYLNNTTLLESGNSPFKNAYFYIKTLPEFQNATDVDL
jgi:hypothetical protein